MTSNQASPSLEAPALSERSIARAVSWSWTGNLVSQIAWFGSLIILGTLLPPDSFGTVAIGLVIANAAMLVQDAGSRGSIVAAQQLHRPDVARSLALNLGLGLAMALGLILFAEPIVEHLASGGSVLVVQILLLSVAIRSAAIVPMAVLQRTMQFKLQSSVTAGATLFAGIAAVVAGLAGAGVWALVVRQLVAASLLPLFAWFVAVKPLRLELRRGARPRKVDHRRRAHWFFLLATADFFGLSLDSVIVGHSVGASQLGVYALAFTLAFAPLTNFAWQIGKVIFPAAAASADLESIIARMLRSLRLAGGILLPLLPPTLVLAPVVLPALFGPEWDSMVVPFQILVIVAVGHALTIMIGDSLSGTGHIAFRARVHMLWCVGMVVSLVLLVHYDGIRGAAFAHALMFIPFAAAYLLRGTRLLGTDPAAVFGALRILLLTVGAQLVITVAFSLGLQSLGAPEAAAASVAACAGLLLVAVLLFRFEDALVSDSRRFVRAVVSR